MDQYFARRYSRTNVSDIRGSSETCASSASSTKNRARTFVFRALNLVKAHHARNHHALLVVSLAFGRYVPEWAFRR